MAYEFSGSIALGTIVTQNVSSTNHNQNRRSGGRFSPSGTQLAVPVFVAPGNMSKVEIYKSGSSGWEMVEDFLSGTPAGIKNPSMLTWLSETSLALGLRGPGGDIGVYTYVSSSDHGYFHNTNHPSVRRTLAFDAGGMMVFNPSKTLMINYKPYPAASADNKTNVHIVDDDGLWNSVQVPSNPSGEEYIASVEWLSDTDFAVGQPAHTEAGGGSNHGKINIYRTTDGGSSYTSIESVVGQSGDKIGASLYYHTASGNLIVGTGTPTSEAVDDTGGNKWYLYQSSSTGGYLQGTTDRTELTSTGSWSGRVPLDYNAQADDANSRFVIQTLPTFNTANAEVLVWESGSEGWKGSVIDHSASYKTIGQGSHSLVGISRLGFVANNNDVSPTDNADDKSFRVHTLGESCETLSEYQLSGAVTCGKVTATIVDTPAFTNTHGGSISPDGNRIAVSSQRHGGAPSTNHGIDLWHSGSGGWTRVDSIDAASGTQPLSIYWFSNSELLALTSLALTSYVSNSSGWSTNYTTSLGSDAMAHMWVSPGKTVIGIGHSNNVFSSTFMDDTEDIILVHSSSTGFDDLKTINSLNGGLETGRVTAMAWPDEENVLIGQPEKNSVGRVTHFRSGSSGYTSIRTTEGNATSTNGVLRFGSFIYWHSASNSGIYGANDGHMALNLIPSQSDGYLPASNPHTATGRSIIDTSMLRMTNGNEPQQVLGTTINVDPANPSRVVATTIRRANESAQDGRVYFSLESGSLGWKVKQINADGDGVGGPNAPEFNRSQLTPGASRFVTFKTGSGADASTNNRFTIYETGLPIGGSGGGGGGAASYTLSQSTTPLNITEGSTGTVGVVLGKQPTSDVVISATLAGSFSGRATLSAANLTFTNANWNTQQNITVTATANNVDDDNATGNITFSVVDASSDDDFDPLADQTIALTVVDNNTAGFTLTPSASPLNITEGSTGTISVVLNSQPASGNVVIDIAAAGTLSGRATLDKTSLTFTTANWNSAQVVTVTATANNVDDDNATGNLTFSVNDGSTADTKFDALADQTVAVTVVDNNTAGFTLTPSASPLNITEGSTGTISVVLNSQPASGNVVIDVTPAGGLSGRASLDKSSLTFTTANWNSAQTVTVTAIADNIDNDNTTANVTFSVNDASTADAKFDALSDQTVAVTIVDNDTAAFVVAPDNLQLSTTEAGATATLSVKLATEPTHAVTITLSGLDATENTMSPNPAQLVFDSTNFSTSQTITLTGIEDEEIDGNIVYTMTLSASSADGKYNNMQKTITVTNVDSGNAPGSSDDGSTGATTGRDQVPPFPAASGSAGGSGGGGGGTGRTAPAVRTQADILPRRMHFEPSTIETIDKSVLSYLQKLDLFSNTNEGWRKVPIIWGTAERAYQVKHNKDVRDAQGMLKLPLISLRRVSLTKDMGSKGVFQANIPGETDEQGGSVQVSRVVYQDKTSKFASADALRLYNQENYPRPNPKVVYRTVSAPMPVNVTVMYEILLRTEYQQQMNALILPFVTTPGTINYVRLFEGEHRFEAFIQGDFQNNGNLANYSSEERKFETKIQLKVVGYLIGQEDNREKPHYSVRENAVEVKIPRERISLKEVPPHEFGAYYGLSGITDPLIFSGIGAPFFFSNVPAASAGSSTTGGVDDGPASGNLVTTTNFSQVMADNLVIREVLKNPGENPGSGLTTFTISGPTIRANTESVYLNGVLQEVGVGKDYTISGNVITFAEALVVNDNLYVTYIKS